MRSFIALSLCLALVVACNPNRIKKEYSTADIEYNSKSNFWTQKSDGSIIKVNFAITDEIVDGIPCRREVMVDKYGVVETSDLYNYTTHIEHCDYSQAPNQIRITLYPTHPDNKTGTKVYHQKVRGSEGYTVFVKDMYEETVAEMI